MEPLPPDYLYPEEEQLKRDPELDQPESGLAWLAATGMICLLAFGSMLLAIVSTP